MIIDQNDRTQLVIYRQAGDKSRQWLVRDGHNDTWRDDQAQATVFELSISEYLSVITRIDNSDMRYKFVFGHEPAL